MVGMNWRRVLVPLLVTLLSLPVLCGGLALGLLQMPATQQWLRDRLAGNGRFEIDGLSIVWPLTLHADRLRLVDQDGPWLSMSDVLIDCSPGELWWRTLRVRRLSAARLVVVRRPLSGAGDAAGPPRLPLKVVIDRLSVAVLSLDRRLFGRAAEAGLSAVTVLDDGRLTFSLRLTGRFADDPSSLGLAAEGRADLAAGIVDLGRLRLSRGSDRLFGGGRVEGWGRGLAFLFFAETEDAAPLLPGFGGHAMVRGAVGGSLDQPRLSARVTATSGRGGIGALLGPAPRLSLSLALSRPSGVALAWLRLVGEGTTLTAGGRLGVTLLAGARGQVAELGPVSGGRVHGPAEASALAVGPLSDPVIGLRGAATVLWGNLPASAQLLAVVGKLHQQPAGAARLEVSAAGRSAWMGTVFRWGETMRLDDIALHAGDSTVTGSIAWRPGTTQLEGKLHGSVPDLAAWQSVAGVALGGSLGVDLLLTPVGWPALTLDLTMSHPVLGRLRLNSLRAEATGRPDDLSVGLSADGFRARGRVRPGGCQLSAQSLDLGPHHGGIEATASINWDGGRLSGQAAARGDLGRVAEFLPLGDQNVGGAVNVALRLGGTLDAPTLAGRLEVTDGSYRNFDSGTVLTGITLAAVADDIHHVRVDGRGGDGGKGTFTVDGEINPVSGEAGLKARLDHLAVARLDLFQGDATGDLGFTRDGNQATLSGGLTLSGGQMDIGQLAPASIVPLKVVEVNAPPSGVAPPPTKGPDIGPAMPMVLALDLVVADSFVRGKGLDSLWKGRLHLAGPMVGGGAAPLVVTGQLTVVRGSYTLFGVPLQLSGGTVSFDGEQPPDPRIDATASGRSSGATVQLRLSGTLKKPDFAFTSDPPMPKDEVLAHLLFGNAAGQLSVMQQITLARAAATQLTGEGAGFDPLDKLRGFLGLDMLQAGGDMSSPLAAPGMPDLAVTTGGQPLAAAPTAKSSGASLSAGKYIGSRTYLRVDQGTTGGRVTVEADLGHGFAVDTRLGEATGGAVGFSWKKDY